MTKVKITLIKSTNSANKKHIATVKALGLQKIGQTVEHEATRSILGMVRHVAHLVRCEEV
ncbi:MAG: 50S ribosomal protein L30 [Clostridiaceae bacterium]|jgi:large subunit ribosomal protein L30|nr:50S ribosomal protein L30 [Eubacteriales bacterium]NLV48521.1 50S ribosomal protein L30 [Clostridiaceae bacterium]